MARGRIFPVYYSRVNRDPQNQKLVRARDAEYQAVWSATIRRSEKDDYQIADLHTRHQMLETTVRKLLDRRRREGRRMFGADAAEVATRHLHREAEQRKREERRQNNTLPVSPPPISTYPSVIDEPSSPDFEPQHPIAPIAPMSAVSDDHETTTNGTPETIENLFKQVNSLNAAVVSLQHDNRELRLQLHHYMGDSAALREDIRGLREDVAWLLQGAQATSPYREASVVSQALGLGG